MTNTISTGEPATLGTYRKIALAISGDETSKVVKFFDDKIQKSPKGEDEEVIASETQVMFIIGQLILGG
jgi:hypothetical protein